MALEAIWTEEYDITSYLVDFRKRLSLQGLLNLLQEAAWRHAAHLGHGYEETRSVGTFWVLVRQLVQVDVWPLWEEKLPIRTWLRPPISVVVTRDFELSVAGRPVGRAAAHWLTIDHHTRRPSPLPFPKDTGLFRKDGHLSIEPKKLQVFKELQQLTEFQVRTSDLDMNGHVNNTRFAQWVLDSLPLEVLEAHELRSYEINFLAEAHHRERIDIRTPIGRTDHYFQGHRTEDDRLLFVAKIDIEKP
ncbi:MAG: hypothetical protein KC800_30095 [Candidatus Eremiobacteraeota bacterium]|nr:hypothetical protein [Candidatus Eremiobacteraeota bacterium]